MTVGSRGVRQTVGLPGTGLWYTDHSSGKNQRSRRSTPRSQIAEQPTIESTLNLGFFQKLLTPAKEKSFIEGLKALHQNKPEEALKQFREAGDLPDALFCAAMMAMRIENIVLAEGYLKRALGHHAKLGTLIEKYGLTLVFEFKITERIRAKVTPSRRGILLALAEVHQADGRWKESIEDLRALYRQNKKDNVVCLSLCEILVSEKKDTAACKEVVRMTASIENESEIEAAILLWKGIALNRIKKHSAALETLSRAFRRKKDRSKELLNAIRLERAKAYKALGKNARYKSEMEILEAEGVV